MRQMTERIVAWYRECGRRLPWRADREPYRIWVSEIMLQQTRIETVLPYYERFMKRLPDIAALAACDDEELHKLWEGLGYYSRVRNLKKAAQKICTEYNGIFPEEYDLIRQLPGVGDYTAGAIASMAFGQKRAAVDGNVARVITRLLACDHDIMDAAFRRELTKRLDAVYPDGAESELTQGLMELGEVLCIPHGVPLCEGCPVRNICLGHALGVEQELPRKKAKAARRLEDLTVIRLTCGERLALVRRPPKGLLAGLWAYPHLPGKLSEEEIIRSLPYGEYLTGLHRVGEDRHIFTHVEWQLHCYEAELTEEGREQAGAVSDLVWVDPEELETGYALPTAFKKLFRSQKRPGEL